MLATSIAATVQVLTCRVKLLHSNRTLVPPHPNLQAVSCAINSPNPNIRPLINGKNRFIAAPLNILQKVGGEYNMSGEEEDDAGSSESCELEWFAS